MKSLQHHFADLTSAIEDLHAVAVEGQAPLTTPDVHEGLFLCVRTGMKRIEGIAGAIGVELARARQ